MDKSLRCLEASLAYSGDLKFSSPAKVTVADAGEMLQARDPDM